MQCVYVQLIVKSCVGVGDGSSVEIVNEFCYLGNMLFMDDKADAPVTTRIQNGWFRFSSLPSILTAKDVSLLCTELYVTQK